MSTCDNCGDIRLVKLFRSPYEYLQCVEYIKDLIAEGGFELLEGNCSLDEVKDDNGWADDIIYHAIRCKKCGQVYSCCCNTYRGGGSFGRGR